MNTQRGSDRGVSLVEALVALAVMGLGMLGVIGLQSSLRQNADLARQRAEALRLAQQPLEVARSYSSVGVAVGKLSFDGVVTPPVEAVVGTNATYTRTFTVTRTANHVLQNYATLDVQVSWTDRTNTPQQVRLSSAMHRTPPELSFALSVPGDRTVTQTPLGRHPSIPRNAVDIGRGESDFSPPEADGRRWIFNNTTGVVIALCDRDEARASCEAIQALPVSGFIAFATHDDGPPTKSDAERPPGDARETRMRIRGVPPDGAAPTYACVVEQPGEGRRTALAYFCLVRISVDVPRWSGQTLLDGLSVAADALDSDPDRVRVCRYTPYRNNDAVGTGRPAIKNTDHPFAYEKVDVPLINQNFLVIRAGDDRVPFECPDDRDPAPDLLNGRTWPHQPTPG